MQVGYARVSKQHEQDTAAQLRALEVSGAERVFTEHASGGRWDRPELHNMLDQLRAGDTVIVWKLDRRSLSLSLKDVLHLMELLGERGVGFRSLTEAIDTTRGGPKVRALYYAKGKRRLKFLGFIWPCAGNAAS